MRTVAAAVVSLGLCVAGLRVVVVHAQEAKASALVVLDSAGKEIPLKTWKFTQGTKHLSWLVEPKKVDPKKDEPQKSDDKKGADKKDAEKKDEPKTGKKPVAPPPVGPEYLALIEDKTPTYVNDVTTFVPLASLKKIEFDHDKSLVRVIFVKAGGKDDSLVASTKFTNVNRITLEGEAEPSAFSVSGKLQFQEGFLKGPVLGYRFADPQPVAEPTGRWASITVNDAKKTVHKAADLTPLYKVGAGFQTASFLMFQKTVKIDFAKLTRLTIIPPKDKKLAAHDFDVTLTDGTKQGLTLLEKAALDGGQPGVLAGLVGRVPAGYKLFPAHIIVDLTFDSSAKE